MVKTVNYMLCLFCHTQKKKPEKKQRKLAQGHTTSKPGGETGKWVSDSKGSFAAMAMGHLSRWHTRFLPCPWPGASPQPGMHLLHHLNSG